MEGYLDLRSIRKRGTVGVRKTISMNISLDNLKGKFPCEVSREGLTKGQEWTWNSNDR